MVNEPPRERSSWRRPPRPAALSDPHDFHPPEARRALLAKEAGALEGRDLALLFGPLSAGTFEEAAFFLPHAFRYLQACREDPADLLSGLALWLPEHATSLDGLCARSWVESELRGLFAAWTRDFEVVHCDAEECAARGYALTHYDEVVRAKLVAKLLHELVAQEVWARVAEDFVEELGASGTPVQAAWFLEVARWQEEGLVDRVTGELDTEEEEEELANFARALSAEYDLGMDESLIEDLLEQGREAASVRSEAIVRLVRDPERRRHAATRLEASDLYDAHSTYWRDTFRCLALDA